MSHDPHGTQDTLRLAHLRRLVELHDNFWHELLARQPNNSELLAFVADEWGPWYVQWSTLPWTAGYDHNNQVDLEFITAAAQALSSLRQAAESRGVPFPDLGTARRGVDWNLQASAGRRAPRPYPGTQVHASGDFVDIVGRRFGGAGTRRRPRYQATSRQIFQSPGGEETAPRPEDMPDIAPYPYENQEPGRVVEVVPGVPTEVNLARPRAATMSGGELSAVGRHHQHASQDTGGGELAAAARVVTPGAGGVSINLEFDGVGRLHAAVCVDGHCYQGSADLAPLLTYQADQAVQSAQAAATTPVDPSDAATAAVEAAGDMLVGALLDQHSTTVSAGWWSSVTHAVSSAAKGVYNAGRHTYNATTGVVAKFKGPITVAATAVATAYGGPAAGAAAAKFTGPILDAAHDGFNKPEAKKTVAEIKEAAKSNPQIAHAFDVAQKAVAETTAAYHIVDTAGQALNGDKSAIRKIGELGQAATSGDPAASKAMAMIFEAIENYSGGDADYEAAVSSGADAGSLGPLNDQAVLLVAEMATRSGAPFVGYVREHRDGRPTRGAHGGVVTLGDTEECYPFSSQADADHWLTTAQGAPNQGTRVYVAYYDTSPEAMRSTGPNLIARFSDVDTTIGGVGLLTWMALGAGVGASYIWWHRARDHRRRQERLDAENRAMNDAAIAAMNAEDRAKAAIAAASVPTVAGFWPAFLLGAGSAAFGSAMHSLQHSLQDPRCPCPEDR